MIALQHWILSREVNVMWNWRIAVICLLCCAGCQGQVSRQLPPDWPIGQLKLDPAWELKHEVAAMHRIDPVKYKNPEWLVVFDKQHDWPGVVAHVEKCLKPLGFLRLKSHGTNNPLGLDLPETRTYYTTDYLTEVLISNGTHFDDFASPDAEFALMITHYSTPPEPFASALSVNKSRPGSGMGDKIVADLVEPIT
jgi:hypothetical protein